MSDKITFYYNPMSRGRIVHWMLEEVSVPYEIKFMDFAKGDHKSPAYLAINPMGKIPAIVHRGVVVTECAAICAYLADAFPEKNLAPAVNAAARGTYYRWLFFGAGCMEPALVDRMLDRAAPKASTTGYGSFDGMVNALETALQPGPFITGSAFSAADVYIAAQIGWGFMTKVLPSTPILTAYLARCADRPAYVKYNRDAEKMTQESKK